MRYLLFCILLLLPAISNAQFTSTVWAGSRYNHSSDVPVIPYQQEVLDYQDSLWANGITDTVTGIDALNWLVWSLKGNNPAYPFNFWDSLTAVYPVHGGTAYSHSINIKDVAGVKISWLGSPTHDANGVTGNGSSAYGNTNLRAPVPNERVSGFLISALTLGGSALLEVGAGTSNNPNDWVAMTYTYGAVYVLNNSVLSTGWSPSPPSGKHMTIYGQNDNRLSDSLRRWGSNNNYLAAAPGTRITGSGNNRYYGIMGRITNFAGTAAAPYTWSTVMGQIISFGKFTPEQGRWLVDLYDEYIFKLRGLTP